MVPFGDVEAPGVSGDEAQPQSLGVDGLRALLARRSARFGVLGHDSGRGRHWVWVVV